MHKKKGFSIFFFSDGEADQEPVKRRESSKRRDFRHAYSEVLPDEDPNRRSQAMIDVKAHAINRLRDELQIAQTVSILTPIIVHFSDWLHSICSEAFLIADPGAARILTSCSHIT